MHRLLAAHLNLTGQGARAFLEERGFYRGVDPLGDIGNTYSASLYLFPAHLLAARYQHLGPSIVGSRILLASYGSGNTMIVISGRVAGEAPEVIRRWKLEKIRDSRQPAGMREYEIWSSGSHLRAAAGLTAQDPVLPPGQFYLSSIREDGYREYRHAAEYKDWVSPAEAPAELRQSVPVLN